MHGSGVGCGEGGVGHKTSGNQSSQIDSTWRWNHLAVWGGGRKIQWRRRLGSRRTLNAQPLNSDRTDNTKSISDPPANIVHTAMKYSRMQHIPEECRSLKGAEILLWYFHPCKIQHGSACFHFIRFLNYGSRVACENVRMICHLQGKNDIHVRLNFFEDHFPVSEQMNLMHHL